MKNLEVLHICCVGFMLDYYVIKHKKLRVLGAGNTEYQYNYQEIMGKKNIKGLHICCCEEIFYDMFNIKKSQPDQYITDKQIPYISLKQLELGLYC